MSLSLAEYQRMTTDPLKKWVISVFTGTSQVLKFLSFQTINGNSYTFNRESDLGNVGFRDYDEEYTEGGGTTSQDSVTYRIFGGSANVDRARIATQNTNDILAVQRKMKLKAMARFWDWAFFKSENSSANDTYFNGMEAEITGDQLIDHSGTALDLDAVDELIDTTYGDNKVLFMNRKMRRKINSLMRASGAATEVVNTRFGFQFNGYGDVPIALIDEDHEGNQILDWSDDSSPVGDIYCISFGEDQVAGLQAQPMNVWNYGLIPGTVYYSMEVEHIATPVIYNLKAASRLQNIAEPA